MKNELGLLWIPVGFLLMIGAVAALFLTVHSVETTLTRVYRKLEVRSRAERAHLFAANS